MNLHVKRKKVLVSQPMASGKFVISALQIIVGVVYGYPSGLSIISSVTSRKKASAEFH